MSARMSGPIRSSWPARAGLGAHPRGGAAAGRFDRLAYNIRQNPFGTIKAVACAVADKTGELTLFLDPRNKGESSVKIVGSSQAAMIRVPAVTLLDLLSRRASPGVDALKLDVEGAEDLILGPFFRDAPASLHPALFIIEDGRERWQIDLGRSSGTATAVARSGPA